MKLDTRYLDLREVAIPDFLDLDLLDAQTLRLLLDYSARLKRSELKGQLDKGRVLALLFEKPSTRTRISFEVAMHQLGGEAITLIGSHTQLQRGESISDTARTLSRYVDVVMLRTHDPKRLDELAQACSVPVINGLTDLSHPCQVLADVLTFEEHRGSINGRTIAWSGDFSNVARSWVHAAVRLGFTLRLAIPQPLTPPGELLKWAQDNQDNQGRVELHSTPAHAVDQADAVVTDSWFSMRQGEPEGDRLALLTPYRVDRQLMSLAAREAIFMHCLPASRGLEVESEVIDGSCSVVWDEAENRLHTQKAILLWCLGCLTAEG